MPIQQLRINLIYLRKSNSLTQYTMDAIAGHRSKLIDIIEHGGCVIQLEALKRISDRFKISIDDLCSTEIRKHSIEDLEDYYNSAILSLTKKTN